MVMIRSLKERVRLLIDTHIHMVPGVDDGAKDMDTAIQMLEVAINEGVDEMILTPHFNLPVYNNQNVAKNYNLLNQYVLTQNIDFKIHLGNEIYLSEEDIAGIKNGQAHTMGDTRYLLIELPLYHFYPFHEVMIYDLQNNGYKIVIAHVERYQIFKKEPEKLHEFVNHGICTQITSSYIMNKKTRRRALELIKSGLIHIVASDGHGIDWRPPVMKMAYDIVAKAFGQHCAHILFVENPKLMIEDRVLMVADIEQVKRFHLFFT